MENIELAAFVKSASSSLDIDEATVYEIMQGDDDASYMRHHNNYTKVMDAVDVWRDAIQFYKSQENK
jgi:hypothetical protein